MWWVDCPAARSWSNFSRFFVSTFCSRFQVDCLYCPIIGAGTTSPWFRCCKWDINVYVNEMRNAAIRHVRFEPNCKFISPNGPMSHTHILWFKFDHLFSHSHTHDTNKHKDAKDVRISLSWIAKPESSQPVVNHNGKQWWVWCAFVCLLQLKNWQL